MLKQSKAVKQLQDAYHCVHSILNAATDQGRLPSGLGGLESGDGRYYRAGTKVSVSEAREWLTRGLQAYAQASEALGRGNPLEHWDLSERERLWPKSTSWNALCHRAVGLHIDLGHLSKHA